MNFPRSGETLAEVRITCWHCNKSKFYVFGNDSIENVLARAGWQQASPAGVWVCHECIGPSLIESRKRIMAQVATMGADHLQEAEKRLRDLVQLDPANSPKPAP